MTRNRCSFAEFLLRSWLVFIIFTNTVSAREAEHSVAIPTPLIENEYANDELRKRQLPTTTSALGAVGPTSLPTCQPPSPPKATSAFCENWEFSSLSYGQVNGSCLPIMDFVNVTGVSEYAINVMCEGLLSKYGSNSAVLTWSASSASLVASRRRAVNCNNAFCAGNSNGAGPNGVCKGSGDLQTNLTECAMFPPASTADSLLNLANGAHKACVPWCQNSGLVGPMLRCYADAYGLKDGDQFVYRVATGCTGSKSLTKREYFDARNSRRKAKRAASTTSIITSIGSDSGYFVPDPQSQDVVGVVVAPWVEYVGSGLYQVDILVDAHPGGPPTAVEIIDSSGLVYASVTPPYSSTLSVNFTLSDEDNLIIAAPVSQNCCTSIGYTGVVKPIPGSKSDSTGIGNLKMLGWDVIPIMTMFLSLYHVFL